MKNKIDKSRHSACIHKENRNAVVYCCRDVAIILRQPYLKSHSVSIPSIMNVFEQMFVCESKMEENVNSLS